MLPARKETTKHDLKMHASVCTLLDRTPTCQPRWFCITSIWGHSQSIRATSILETAPRTRPRRPEFLQTSLPANRFQAMSRRPKAAPSCQTCGCCPRSRAPEEYKGMSVTKAQVRSLYPVLDILNSQVGSFGKIWRKKHPSSASSASGCITRGTICPHS